MSGCYILFSEKIQKFYVGATKDDVHNCIEKPNTQFYGTHKFTAVADDWNLFLFIATKDYSQALRIEKKIKSMKSSKFIRNLKGNEALVNWLITSV